MKRKNVNSLGISSNDLVRIVNQLVCDSSPSRGARKHNHLIIQVVLFLAGFFQVRKLFRYLQCLLGFPGQLDELEISLRVKIVLA